MFPPVADDLRRDQHLRDVQNDPNRMCRFVTIVFYGSCAIGNGASSLLSVVRAVHAAFLGAMPQCLLFAASAVILYDVARSCWNLAKMARDRNAYYEIFPNILIVDATGVRGRDSGVWEIRKGLLRAILEKTVILSFVLEFAVIPYFNSRYR